MICSKEILFKYERLVKIEFIKTFNSKYANKSFNIKQIFIDLIKIFQQDQFIEDERLLLTNRGRINIHNLTTSNLSGGMILYENFNTNSFLINKV